MHTEYFRTDESDQRSRRENVRIFGIPEDYTVEDDGKKQKTTLETSTETGHSSTRKRYSLQRVHRLSKKKKSKAAKPSWSFCFVC